MLLESLRALKPIDLYGSNQLSKKILNKTGLSMIRIRVVLWTNKSASTSFKLILKSHLINVASDLSLESSMQTVIYVSIRKRC